MPASLSVEQFHELRDQVARRLWSDFAIAAAAGTIGSALGAILGERRR